MGYFILETKFTRKKVEHMWSFKNDFIQILFNFLT